MKRYFFALTAAALLIAGCSDNPLSPFDSDSDAAMLESGDPNESGTSGTGVIPTFYTGNTNAGICDAGQLYFKIDPPLSGTQAGITFTIVEEDQGESLTWSAASNIEVKKVAIKAGNAYNLYSYNPPERTGDHGLIAPLVGIGNVPDISHFDFCYLITEGCVWFGETAWSQGPRYTARGNWAMYSAYEDGLTVDLIAGQHYTIGTVSFADAGGGMVNITIAFNESGRFADVMENLKIQGYDVAPEGNPAPGQFLNKYTVDQGETSVTFAVPMANFYGVHVDAERAVCAAD